MNIRRFFVAFICPLFFCTLSHAALPSLDEGEGYVIIAAYADGYAESIVLEGEGMFNTHTFGPLNHAQLIEIKKLPAGRYQWTEIFEENGSLAKGNKLKIEYNVSDDNLSFTVKPGVINYVGLLMIEKLGSRMRVRQLNRTSIILKILEQDHSEDIKGMTIVNGLYPNDHYIEFYQAMTAEKGE